jgi:hypothetical protein
VSDRERPSVFIAHSSEDKSGPAFFDKMFAAAGVRAYWYPYPSGRTYPHYIGICRAIKEAESLFVVLSKPMELKPHTRSWVSFEVGVAIGLGKNVWVFEPPHVQVEIPVPAATGYLQRPETTTTLRTFVFGDLVKSAGTTFPPPSGSVWFYAVCGNTECREEFLAYVLDPTTARCPACRQPSTIRPLTPAEAEVRLNDPHHPASSKFRGSAPGTLIQSPKVREHESRHASVDEPSVLTHNPADADAQRAPGLSGKVLFDDTLPIEATTHAEVHDTLSKGTRIAGFASEASRQTFDFHMMDRRNYVRFCEDRGGSDTYSQRDRVALDFARTIPKDGVWYFVFDTYGKQSNRQVHFELRVLHPP